MGQLEQTSTTAHRVAETKGRKTRRHPNRSNNKIAQAKPCSSRERGRLDEFDGIGSRPHAYNCFGMSPIGISIDPPRKSLASLLLPSTTELKWNPYRKWRLRVT